MKILDIWKFTYLTVSWRKQRNTWKKNVLIQHWLKYNLYRLLLEFSFEFICALPELINCFLHNDIGWDISVALNLLLFVKDTIWSTIYNILIN